MTPKRLLALASLLLVPAPAQATGCHALPPGGARAFCEWLRELQSADGLDSKTRSLARGVWREMGVLLSTNRMDELRSNLAGWNAELVQSLKPYARHLDDRPLRQCAPPPPAPRSFEDETREFVAEWRALEAQLREL